TALPLNGYQDQIVRLDVPFTGQDSRLFQSFTFAPTQLQVDNGTGNSPTILTQFDIQNPDGSLTNSWPPSPYSIAARVFPGRNTSLPIFVDDSMFSVQQDPNLPPANQTVAAFNEAQF